MPKLEIRVHFYKLKDKIVKKYLRDDINKFLEFYEKNIIVSITDKYSKINNPLLINHYMVENMNHNNKDKFKELLQRLDKIFIKNFELDLARREI